MLYYICKAKYIYTNISACTYKIGIPQYRHNTEAHAE